MVKLKQLDCLIQTRITSSRFPGKVLKLINNNSIIEIIFKRVSKSKNLRKIIFLIPDNKKNNQLKYYLKRKKYSFMSGSEKNVLSRYYNAAKKIKSKFILRVTSDCPFVDSNLIDKLFLEFKKKKFNYASNTNPPSFPDGLDIEIFDFKSLEEAFLKTKKKTDLEHVTPFLIRNRKLKKYNLKNNKDLSNYKISIDTKQDFDRVEKIFKYFGNIHVKYKSVMRRLTQFD